MPILYEVLILQVYFKADLFRNVTLTRNQPNVVTYYSGGEDWDDWGLGSAQVKGLWDTTYTHKKLGAVVQVFHCNYQEV
jgi:hypothetical protein